MIPPAETQPERATKFRFGLFEADLKSGELRRSGIRVRTQDQPFRVLQCLLERAGQVVSRKEIQERLWGPDASVDVERSLASAIHKIRECLGDSVVNPRFIETLARSGYRFIAPVTVVDVALVQVPEPPVADPDKFPQNVSLLPVIPNPQHRKRIGSSRFWIAAGFVGILAGIGTYLAERDALPRQSSPVPITQVTFSGRIAPGEPAFEGSPDLRTDGSRLYLPQIENGKPVLAEVLISGGETTPLPLPEEMTDPSLEDLSPDGSHLLLGNRVPSRPEQPLWIVAAVGESARRIPGILAHSATWTPDGQSILYATGHDLDIVRDDGLENRRLATLPGPASQMRWSPDGKKIRFTLLGSGHFTSRLWEVSADGSQLHPLLDGWIGAPSECCGDWTPDGRYYVFQAIGWRESNIWAIPEHGGFFGGPRKPFALTNGPLRYSSPIAAPNGRQAFFVGRDARSQLMELDRKSGRFLPYSDGATHNASRVDFSRDGQWIAWTRPDDGALWRSRIDGSEPLELTGGSIQVSSMRWSQDDRQIAMVGRQAGEPWTLYVVDAASGHLQKLLHEDRSEDDADWSPDGKTLVFGRVPDAMVDPAKPKGIYFVDLATRKVAIVPGSEGTFHPRWSPNGEFIVALSLDKTKLMLYELATKTWRQYAGFNIQNPAWSHDSTAVVFQDTAQAGQPIFRLSIATGKMDRLADLRDLRSAGVIDCRLAGLAPGDRPVVSARTSAADIYSADLPH